VTQDGGYNLVGVANSANSLGAGNDLTGTAASPLDPMLSPLGYYGGPTETMVPEFGSPAIGAGSPGGPDQRGLMGSADIGAFQTQPGLVVNTAGDTSTGAEPYGDLSLRDAINVANVAGSASFISFNSPLSSDTITLAGSQLPEITANVTITGLGANDLAISGNNQSRVFDIASGAIVEMSGLTITQGDATGFEDGGGIYNNGTLTLTDCVVSDSTTVNDGGGIDNSGTLTLRNTTVSGNVASFDFGGIDSFGNLYLYNSTVANNQAKYDGGIGIDAKATLVDTTVSGNTANADAGIFIDSSYAVTILDSTISNNTATNGGGGGIFNDGALTVTDSTIAGNIADNGNGGGVYNWPSVGASVTLTDSTVTGNQASGTGSNGYGGGIFNGQSLTVQSSIIAGNSAQNSGPDIFDGGGGTTTDNGYNLIGNTSGSSGFTASTDHLNVSADLAPLGYYGGPTETLVPLPGSPAIGAGSSSQSFDQRGFSRSVSGSVDIGAFQTQSVIGVNTNDDTATGAEPSGELSLRDAINLANVLTPDSGSSVSAIQFSTGLNSETITLAGVELPKITSNVQIHGENAGNLSVSGNGQSRVFDIGSGTHVTIIQLTIEDGDGTTVSGGTVGNGGAILNAGQLALVSSTVSGSTATNGGGIYSTGSSGYLFLIGATVTGNTAMHNGGGVWSNSSYHFGTMLDGSTISANHAGMNGGGMYLGGGHAYLDSGTSVQDNAATGGNGGGIYVNALARVSLTDSTVSNNTAFASGGGIDNLGTLTLTAATVSGNNAGNGGGIYNSGTLTLTDSTVSGNGTVGYGGGIDNFGTLTITNSTLYGNTASSSGGGIEDRGPLTIDDSTIAGNTGETGGGIDNYFGNYSVTLTNTIVAGNSTIASGGYGPDVANEVTSGGHNLIGNDTNSEYPTSGWVSTDLLGTAGSPINPELTTLGYYGGPTETLALEPGSPAIGAGTSVLGVSTDQRGFGRGSSVDIGAFQTQASPLQVNVAFDSQSGSEPSGDVSLRDAINLANALSGGVISFANSLLHEIITLAGVVLPTINANVTIQGPGAALLAISGNNQSRVFQIGSLPTVTISGLTIEDGHESSSGGGISNGGTLTLTDSVVSGNSVTGWAGGIYNSGTLNVADSTISGNTSYGAGGIYDTGNMTITDSTISGNTSDYGGGIYLSFSAAATVKDSTIADNAARFAGGIAARPNSTLVLQNTIVAGNSASFADPDIRATITTDDGYNLVGITDGSSGLSAGSDQTGTSGNPLNPLLGPLQYNGGTTETLALLSGSPAIEAGDPTQAGTTAQNGVVRPAGLVDIGAFQTLNPLLVTTTTDSGAGSLRAAIAFADSNGGGTITFAIPGSGPFTIQPLTALPDLTSGVSIDGTSQPGYGGTPIIVLSGALAGSGVNGLTLTGSSSTVQGLVINNFGGNGIELDQGGDTVSGNWIGVAASGTTAAGNSTGIFVTSAGNTIGGTTAGARNVISGNTGNGVIIVGDNSNGNLIEGNYIGTDASGTHALGNHDHGVAIASDLAAGNIIGGTAPGAGNVISGSSFNNSSGIVANGTDTLIEGNLIGTDKTGTLALGNVYGITIGQDTSTTIGGTTAAARNITSGNQVGIDFSGGGGAVISGNYIGTDISGNNALPNTNEGIAVYQASGVTIGGTASGAGNVISGNTQWQVGIGGSATTTGNIVVGNYIGTNAAGSGSLTGAAGGDQGGVQIYGGANGNTIGGTTAGAGNIISGNSGDGIDITGSGTTGNVVEGNYVGSDVTGIIGVANGGDGIDVSNASNNTIGGTTAAARNIISGNTGAGVQILAGNGNVVDGNFIGTDRTGSIALGNQHDGVDVWFGASTNTIGGPTSTPGSGAGNVISGNQGTGIYVANANTTTIQGNIVGLDVNGTTARPNFNNGVILYQSSNNTIGGSTPGAGNVISGNSYYSEDVGTNLEINAAGVAGSATGNVVQGNFIGTNAAGTAPPAGQNLSYYGVLIENEASGNTIGGDAVGAGNTIAFSAGAGVDIDGAGTTGNAVLGNTIYGNTGLGIDLSSGATTYSPLDSPIIQEIITRATTTTIRATTTTIIGSYTSTPNTTFDLDFFANPPGSASPLQGPSYLGSVTVETDSTGLALFNAALPGASATNDVFNATVTVAGFNTSEFSGPIAPSTTASDIPPVVTTGGPTTDPTGVPTSFSSGLTDASPAASSYTFTYAWSVMQVGNPAFNSAGQSNPEFTLVSSSLVTDEPTLQFTPTAPGTYIIGLTVSDNLGGAGTSRAITLVVSTPGPGVVIQNASAGHAVPTATTANTHISLTSNVTKLDGGTASSHVWSVTGGPYTVEPSTGSTGPNYNNGPNFNFIPTGTGPYGVTLTVTDSAGGTGSASAYITVSRAGVAPDILGAPKPALSAPTSVEVGTPITLGDGETSTGLTYSWSVTGGTYTLPTGATTTASTFTFTPTSVGTDTITVTVSDAEGDSAQQTATINVTAIGPQVTIGGDPVVSSSNTPVMLTSTVVEPTGATPVSYAWSVTGGPYTVDPATGSNGPNFNFTPTGNGVYQVTLSVTDSLATTGLASVPVAVNGPLAAQIVGAPASGLAGTPITVADGLPGPAFGGTLTYTWSLVAASTGFTLPVTTVTNASIFTFTPSVAGAYAIQLSVSDAAGQTATDTVTVAVAASAPLVTIGGDPAVGTSGSEVYLSSSVVDPSGATPVSYAWTVTPDNYTADPSTGSTGPNYNNGPNFNFTPTGSGAYTVTLTVTDSVNSTGTSSASVFVSDNTLSASIIGAPTSGMAGTPITLADSAPPPNLASGVSYSWNVSGGEYALPKGAVTNAATFTFIPTQAAVSYTVTLSVSDTQQQTAQAEVVIAVAAGLPTVAISNTPTEPVAAGASVDLIGSASLPGTNDTFAFSWSVFSSGAGKVVASGTDSTFTYKPSAAGLDFVTLTATDQTTTGVSGAANAIVPVSSASTGTLTLTPVTSLQPWASNQIQASVNAPSPGVTYTFAWSVTGEGVAFSANGAGDTTQATSLFNFMPLTTGLYLVSATATGSDGSIASASQLFQVAPSAPLSAFIVGPTGPISAGTPVSLSAQTSGGAGALRYVWQITGPGGFNLTGTGPSLDFSPTEFGGYSATLAVTDAAGDTATALSAVLAQPVITAQAPTFSADSTGQSVFTVTLTTNGPAAGDSFTYSWTAFDQTTQKQVASGSAQSFFFTGSLTDTYFVMLTVTDTTTGVTGTASTVLLVATPGTTLTLVYGAGGNVPLGTTQVLAIASAGSTIDASTLPSSVTVVEVAAGGHDILMAGQGPSILFGDSGDNSLVGGSGPDTLVATGGDTLMGGTGPSNLFQINPGSGEVAVATAGSQNNTLSFAASSTGVNVSLGQTASQQLDLQGDSLTLSGSFQTLIGSGTGNDILSAGSASNVNILAGGGDDTLTAGTGSNVQLFGGTGNDSLTSSGGSSITLIGGTGNDTLSATNASGALIMAGAGNSTLPASGGPSITLFGGTGNDSLMSSGGSSITLIGGTGNDTLSANGGTGVLLQGGAGNEMLGSSGGSSITMFGGTGNDSLSSTGGSSITLVGGAGNDTLTAIDGTNVSMQAGSGSTAPPPSSGAPSITLFGGTGNDSLSSTGGSSITMMGGSGNDSLTAVNGTDVLMQAGSGGTTPPTTGAPSITLFGGTGNDSLTSSGGSSITMIGGAGNDSLTTGPDSNGAGGSNILILGGTGNTTLSASGGSSITMFGGTGNDSLTSSGGSSITLVGGTGNDSLSSSGGTGVSMQGGTGNDTLMSSGGSSITMFGGTGNDSLTS